MKKVEFTELQLNPFLKFNKQWALISAGTEDGRFNTMTASWGHLGSIWEQKPTAIVYIRPSRYTKQFVDNNDYFSLCFFGEEYRNDLTYLGTVSGRNEDKISKTKLTPVYNDKAGYFKEADLVLICRKIYKQELKEDNFLDIDIMEKHYPERDFHDMYIGEIIETYVK